MVLPTKAENWSPGKPAGSEQIFSQEMLTAKLTQEDPYGIRSLRLLGGGKTATPAESEDRASSHGRWSEYRARGLRPGVQA